jgi:hypothetical protein
MIQKEHAYSVNVTLAITAGLIAISSALLSFRMLNHSQDYSQFAVGYLAWSGESKSGEILAALIFIISLPSAWYLLRWGAEAFERAGIGQHALVILQGACLPGSIWVGQILLNPEWGMGWLLLSLLFFAYWLAMAAAIAIGSIRKAHDGSVYEGNSQIYLLPLFLIPAFTGFSLLGILFAINRTLLWNPVIPAWPLGFVIAASLCIGLFIHHRKRAQATEGALWARVVVYSQIGIPFLAAGLLPTPYIQDGIIQRATPINLSLVMLVVGVGAIAAWDVLRRLRPATHVNKVVSPFALLLCFWIIKYSFTPLPRIPADDWHFGEALLPYFSWYDFGAIPYADLMPVRGFVSVTNAALGNLFFEGTAAAISYSSAIIGLLFSTLVYFPLYYAAGPMAAVLSILILSNDSFFPIGQPDYIFVAAFCTVCILAQRRRYDLAVMAWLVFGPLYLLLAPGYAMLFAIATFPLTGYCVYRAGALGIRRILFVLFGIGMVCVLAVAVPTGTHIAKGIWHYFGDHASINIIGHGIPWGAHLAPGIHASPGHKMDNSTVLEIFRSFSLLIAGVLLVCCAGNIWRYRAAQRGGNSENVLEREDTLDLAISLSTVLTVIVFLPRVLGRIDPNEASRLGSLTLLVMGGLAPLVISRYKRQSATGLLILLFVIIASGINLKLGTPLSVQALLVPQYVHAAAPRLEDGNLLGLKHVGHAQFRQAHLDRLISLKHSMDFLLPEGAPYYDMSNRNAQYVYLGRPVPAEWSGPYYLADESAQARVIEEIRSRKVPVFLLRADNIEHDGGTAALRAYWLYRYVLSNYIPFRLNGLLFAVHRDDADQDRYKQLIGANKQQTIALLEEAFAVANLRSIPISWGASYGTLKARLAQSNLHLVTSAGKDGTILLNMPKENESINQASLGIHDILRLRLECKSPADTEARLSWEGAYGGSSITGGTQFAVNSGTMLVPVGAYPSWILSERRSNIALNFEEHACKVLEAELLRRAAPSIL